jgi:DNA-directed RNA polymerase subunit beta'
MRAVTRCPGAKLLADRAPVTKGQRSRNGITLPIITSARHRELRPRRGACRREVLDETTGITNRVVIDWKQPTRQ